MRTIRKHRDKDGFLEIIEVPRSGKLDLGLSFNCLFHFWAVGSLDKRKWVIGVQFFKSYASMPLRHCLGACA